MWGRRNSTRKVGKKGKSPSFSAARCIGIWKDSRKNEKTSKDRKGPSTGKKKRKTVALNQRPLSLFEKKTEPQKSNLCTGGKTDKILEREKNRVHRRLQQFAEWKVIVYSMQVNVFKVF